MNTHGMHIVVTGGNAGGNLRPSFPRVPSSVLSGWLLPRFTATAGRPGISA